MSDEAQQPFRKSLPADVQQRIIASRASGAEFLARELGVELAQVEEVLARLKKGGRR